MTSRWAATRSRVDWRNWSTVASRSVGRRGGRPPASDRRGRPAGGRRPGAGRRTGGRGGRRPASPAATGRRPRRPRGPGPRTGARRRRARRPRPARPGPAAGGGGRARRGGRRRRRCGGGRRGWRRPAWSARLPGPPPRRPGRRPRTWPRSRRRTAPGWARWRARASRRSGPWGAAVVFDHTGNDGGSDLDAGEHDLERVRRPRHHRAVEGARHRDALRGQARRRQPGEGLGQGRLRPRDHRLQGRVVVGHDDPVDAGDGGGHVGRPRPPPRPSRPGRRPAASSTAAARAVLRGSRSSAVDGAGGGQGHQLAVAVAGGQVGPHAHRRQDLVHGQPGDAEGGLGRRGCR